MVLSKGDIGAAFVLALVSGLVFCAAAGGVEFAGGTGEPNEPYQIATPEQLLGIGTDSDLMEKHYILVASIDLSGLMLTEPPISMFYGAFDGDGYTVRNLRIEGEGEAGLFHAIGKGAEVRNLGMVNVQIIGGSSCGGLASGNLGSVVNCYSTGAVIGATPQEYSGHSGIDREPTSSNIGGLVGSNGATVANCYSTAVVIGGQYVGGLTGQNGGRISSCHATGEVTGAAYVGGLVGSNHGIITSSYSLASVAGQTRIVGGLVGINSQGRITSSYAAATVVCQGDYAGGLAGQNGYYGSIFSCYARGSVAGVDHIGGLVGANSGAVSASYAVTVVTGQGQFVGTLVGSHWAEYPVANGYFLDPADGGGPDNEIGVSLTDAQMKRQASFIGFDFWGTAEDGAGDVWFMPKERYPVLAWQADVTGMLRIPQVSGMSFEEAVAALEAAGFVVGEVRYDFHRTIPANCVINADPHSYAGPGDAIDLVVSLDGTYDWAENPGDGTAANSYQIQTPGQLESLADYPDLFDKHFLLVGDLDMAGRTYEMALIAPDTVRSRDFQGVPFSGVLDGQGHVIRNLAMAPVDIHRGYDYVGLFGMIGEEGRVEDLNLVDADVEAVSGASSYVGILAGYNAGTVTECSATGVLHGGSGDGLVGINAGTMTACRVDIARI